MKNSTSKIYLVLTSFFALTCVSLSSLAFTAQFPVNCQIGQNCFISQYVANNASPTVQDYQAGHLTSPGHQGTDITLANFSQINNNVAVLADADGTVSSVSDGAADHYNRDYNALAESDCGNKVVIEHSNGWQSEYCHLKNGSIQVKPGQTVKAGDFLADVGASGTIDYAGLHYQLSQNGKVVDPFANHVWQQNIPYQAEGLISMGLSNQVTPEYINASSAQNQSQFSLKKDDAIIAWARTYGAQGGELERFVFLQPDGKVYQQPFVDEVSQNFQQVYSYAGYDLSDPAIPKGEWKVVFQIQNQDKSWRTLGERKFSVV